MTMKNPTDDELVEAFKVALREFMKKSLPPTADAHHSTSAVIAKYLDAKKTCMNAGIPESVLQEVVDTVLSERGGVGR